ncbi:hypothetical protein WA026_008789 [Henosepilachna vigintioctopunctata]|uniref:Lipase domain-containing protein n=1 Tax=Henosepilachna vigintioctopunctata TaxID=420089 RepID=A0AAW1V981_9CUCU
MVRKMQLLAIVCCLAVSASAYPDNYSQYYAKINQDTLMKLRKTTFGQEYLSDNRNLKSSVSLSDLNLYLYTRENRKTPLHITNNDVESVVSSGIFNPNKRIISITHGWNNDHKSECNTELLDAILDTHDVNVLVTDWGSIAHEFYIPAEQAVPDIGRFLGDFINQLVSKYGLSYKQVTLIGHSLGAHVAGAAGAIAKEKVSLIIGLDPALPLIGRDPDLHLDPTDAEFVHIIHTCGGFLGFFDPLGHADFYPNGGVDAQPGCFLDLLGTCSHGRSFKYLADSISNSKQKFWAYKCKNYATYENRECDNNEVSFMGTLEPDRSASGSYFLETHAAPPYAYDFNPFEK